MSAKMLVVIPALNAERSIAAVVREAKLVNNDVLVIDDGSSDHTGEMARDAGARVIRHDVNKGKGAALKTGFAYALENGFVTMQKDGIRRVLEGDVSLDELIGTIDLTDLM